MTAQWGGPESSEKRRPARGGSVVDMFEDGELPRGGGHSSDKDRLLGVMEDEFGTIIEDDSGLPVAAQVIDMYKECAEGNFATVDALYAANRARRTKRRRV